MATPRTKPARRKPSPSRRLRLDFSVTGLIYCTIMLFILVAAVNTQANLLFGVFGLMLGILFVCFALTRIVLQRVRVVRQLPEHLTVGVPGTLTYQINNRKRFWPSLSVTVTELDADAFFARPPMAYMLHAANRMTATVSTEVLPRRRGLMTLDHYQLSTSFPFGFIKRAVHRRQADTLLVLPAVGTMSRDVIRRFRSARSGGINVRPSRGGDDEFYGVREYRPGENPRRIYWKRSAGAGPLVIREMTRVSPPRLVLMVDTFARQGTPADGALVERAIAMAATLTDTALGLGMPVGLVAWAGGWMAFKPELGKRHRLDLLGLLATLPPNAEYDAQAAVDQGRTLLRSETTAVLITPYKSTGGFDGPRGGMVVLAAESDAVFGFADGVDFRPPAP